MKLFNFLFLCSTFCTSLYASPTGDGYICFYNYHTRELLEAKLTETKKIQKFFRSRSDAKEMVIDSKLLQLLDHLQDHFQADTIELISGYRSPTLNAALRRRGYNVAEESLHMEGKAADIHIDEVTEEGIATYVQSLKAGGVGYYPENDFVHVDVGELRYWELPDIPSRPFIAMRKTDVWQIYTDKNIYLPKEPVEIVVTNLSRKKQTPPDGVQLEIYRRGEWRALPYDSPPLLASSPSRGEELKVGVGAQHTSSWKPDKKTPFGKFRFVLPALKDFPHLQVRSNEFYRKRY